MVWHTYMYSVIKYLFLFKILLNIYHPKQFLYFKVNLNDEFPISKGYNKKAKRSQYTKTIIKWLPMTVLATWFYCIRDLNSEPRALIK